MELSRAELLDLYPLIEKHIQSLPLEMHKKSHLQERNALQLLMHDIALSSKVIVPTRPAPEIELANSTTNHQSLVFPAFYDGEVEIAGIGSWLHAAWDNVEMELEETNSVRTRSASPSSIRSRSVSPGIVARSEAETDTMSVNSISLPEASSQVNKVEPPAIQVFSQQTVLRSSQTQFSQTQPRKPKRKRGF
jgi:hypothetical protein